MPKKYRKVMRFYYPLCLEFFAVKEVIRSFSGIDIDGEVLRDKLRALMYSAIFANMR